MTDPADIHAHQDEARVAATARAFRARSRRVQLLRRVLPVAIILLAGGTVSWIVLRSVMSDVERKAGTSREIRLDTLRFHGQVSQEGFVFALSNLNGLVVFVLDQKWAEDIQVDRSGHK